MKGPEMVISTLYSCPVSTCKSEYKNKFNLKKHFERVHLGKRPHKCEKCSKFFANKQNLTEHSFIHLGLKPYNCSICKTNFRQASQLSVHKRQHDKNYVKSLNTAMWEESQWDIQL